jgi:hypothetical protein
MQARIAVLISAVAVTGCYVSINGETSTAGSTGDGDTGSDTTTLGSSGDGDGDGDPTGDGDGEPTGDGDGDPTGDGDGDPGDGDPTGGDGDGDGDPTSGDGDGDGDMTTDGCTPEAIELVALVNDYRAENALPPIPASPSLCTVATAHVHDLLDNAPHTQPGCNLHSWSDQGAWSACCYTADHTQAACMWNKPGELTIYPGNGYENAASGAGSPAQALDLWKSSQPHNEVILNLGIWADHPWQALGADVYQGYAVLWFGEEPDPAG